MRVILCLILTLSVYACSNSQKSLLEESNIEYNFSDAITKLKSNQKKDAYNILIKLADQGDAKSANELGRIYQFGVIDEKNCDKAKYWYEKSSELGYKVATHNLAYLYMSNECSFQNISISKKILFENQSYAPSQNLLGVIYIRGLDGNVDVRRGIEYLEKASDQNNVDAINSLGLIYLKGIEVTPDLEKAKMYFDKAILLGDTNALINLASMYLIGNGVKKNEKYAFELIEKAAKKNNAIAQFHLAEFYEKGEIVGKNIEKSKYWYRRSAKNGYSQAQMKL